MHLVQQCGAGPVNLHGSRACARARDLCIRSPVLQQAGRLPWRLPQLSCRPVAACPWFGCLSPRRAAWLCSATINVLGTRGLAKQRHQDWTQPSWASADITRTLLSMHVHTFLSEPLSPDNSDGSCKTVLSSQNSCMISARSNIM